MSVDFQDFSKAALPEDEIRATRKSGFDFFKPSMAIPEPQLTIQQPDSLPTLEEEAAKLADDKAKLKLEMEKFEEEKNKVILKPTKKK